VIYNITGKEMVNVNLSLANRSGKYYDKFKETGLTPLPARNVKPPIIKECVAHLECKLRSEFTTGDHTIFVGEIVEAYTDKEAFTDKYNLKKARMIFHLGGDEFATLKPKVFKPKLRRRKTKKSSFPRA